VLELRVRARVSVGVEVRARRLGYDTPGYEKVRVRNVWKPSDLTCVQKPTEVSLV